MEMNPYKIIVKPFNTEKGNFAKDLRQYTFMVHSKANKVEIAQAVSYIFDVSVVKVRVMNYAPKFGRWGRKQVLRDPAYKKAVVTVAPGQRIEALEGI